jgi:hypothetical protein
MHETDGALDLPFTSADIAARYIEDIRKHPVTLVDAQYDDRLRDDQLQHTLDTGDEPDDLWTWQAEAQWESIGYWIEYNVEKADAEWLTPDDYDAIRDALQENDQSDPFGQLLRQTPARWVRLYLGDVESIEFADEDEVLDAKASIRALLNLGDEGDEASLETVLLNHETGGGVYLYFLADMEAMINDRFQGQGPATITVENPSVLVFDRWSGSGMSAELGSTVTVPYDPEHVTIDQGQGSFSDWVCGGLYGNESDYRIDR